MALTVTQLISDVAREVQDETHVRWTRPELLDYFNAAQRTFAEQRPDQLVQELDLSISGWRHELAPNVHTLMDITNNGNTARKRITKTDLWVLDATVPGWRAQAPQREVLHFMHDIRSPREVLFYPPAVAGTVVRSVVQLAIADLTDESQDASIPERWMDALRHFVLFRAWSKDAEYGGNKELAASHLMLFNQILGVQSKAANEMAPAM